MNPKITNTINYISKLSFLKVWNLFLVKISFFISNIFKKPIVWGNPIAISIEPTTSCNLRCPECPSGLRQFTRPTGMLEFDLLKKIIDQQKKTSNLYYILFSRRTIFKS